MRIGFLPVPPQDASWANGKTAYSINFVINAQDYIAAHPEITPDDLAKLQAEIVALQNGTDSLTQDVLDLDAWLHPPTPPADPPST